ncbi:MAG: FkbM family methyltransferase [Bacteroidia bacterium]|jgi:FkbM family methyltransferase|nr:FkbM family methyltransferase [Bacteroidia bacterium]
MENAIVAGLVKNGSIAVADAGARNGFTLLPQLRGMIDLYAFEPDPGSFAPLQKQYSGRHRFRNAEVSALALSNKAGEAVLYSAAHPSMSSLCRPDVETASRYVSRMADSEKWLANLHTKNEVRVHTETLDYWAAQKHLDYIDFLKLDTQGSELSILHGAADLLRHKKIGVVFTEVCLAPMYENQCSFAELDLWMRHCGYSLIGLQTYPEIADFLNRRVPGRVTEQIHAGINGDAVYIPADKASFEHPGSVALILAALGYYSQSEFLIREHNLLSPADTETLFAHLARRTVKQKLKHLLQRITPPALHYWYSRLRT